MSDLKNFFILLASIAILASCTDESDMIANLESQATISPEEVKKMTDFMKGLSYVDFKYEYVKRPYSKANVSAIMWEASRAVRTSKQSWMKENYDRIKQDFFELDVEELNGKESALIQDMALRFLRGYFLRAENNSSFTESKYLLDRLIANNAVDIDVLADTYLKIENHLSQLEKDEYRFYLKRIYFEEIERANHELIGLRLINAGKEKTDDYTIMRDIEIFERVLESCAYAEGILNLKAFEFVD